MKKSELKAIIKEVIQETQLNEAKTYSKQQVETFLRQTKHSMAMDGQVSDDMAFEVAEGIMNDYPELVAAIKKYWPSATDIQGFIATRL